MDPFPPTHDVFHARQIFDAEQAQVFGCGWAFAGTDDAPLPADPGGLHTLGRLRFVQRGPDPAPLEDWLGPLHAEARALGEAARRFLFEVRMRIRANWKLVVSGAIEDYHVPHVHRTSVDPWRREPAAPRLLPHGHSSYATSAKLGPLLGAFHRALAGGGPAPAVFENHLVYPNLLLVRLCGLVHVTRFIPVAPDETLRVTRLYDHGAPLRPLDPRRALRAAVSAAFRRGITLTFEEDRFVTEEAQAGTGAARHLPRGPAHAEEARVEHFLAETARRLRPAPAV